MLVNALCIRHGCYRSWYLKTVDCNVDITLCLCSTWIIIVSFVLIPLWCYLYVCNKHHVCSLVLEQKLVDDDVSFGWCLNDVVSAMLETDLLSIVSLSYCSVLVQFVLLLFLLIWPIHCQQVNNYEEAITAVHLVLANTVSLKCQIWRCMRLVNVILSCSSNTLIKMWTCEILLWFLKGYFDCLETGKYIHLPGHALIHSTICPSNCLVINAITYRTNHPPNQSSIHTTHLSNQFIIEPVYLGSRQSHPFINWINHAPVLQANYPSLVTSFFMSFERIGPTNHPSIQPIIINPTNHPSINPANRPCIHHL